MSKLDVFLLTEKHISPLWQFFNDCTFETGCCITTCIAMFNYRY